MSRKCWIENAGYSYIYLHKLDRCEMERVREKEREKKYDYCKETGVGESLPRASRFTSAPASNPIPSLLFPNSGGCYRPPHHCTPMNFNSSRRIPGKGTPQIYFFLFRTVRRNKENEGRRRWKREWLNRWRWRSRSLATSSYLSYTYTHYAYVMIQAISIRTPADI